METKHVVSEDQLAGLSEEERAALAEDDDLDTLQEIAGAGNDNDDEDEDDDDDQAADAAAATDSPAGDAAGKPDQAAAADTADEPVEARDDDDDDAQPIYKVDPVENYQQKLDDFAAEKKALREKLTEGDINLDQYEEQKDAIVAKEQAIIRQQDRADAFAEQNSQNAQANWQRTQERFFKADANAIYANNKTLMKALDSTVKDLAVDPANANKPARWFLQEADRQVRAAFGHTTAPTDKEPEPGKKPARKPDLSKIPKTLSGLPSAEISETGGDEFSGMENLSGMDLEREIARRTKTDPTFEKRYLQGT